MYNQKFKAMGYQRVVCKQAATANITKTANKKIYGNRRATIRCCRSKHFSDKVISAKNSVFDSVWPKKNTHSITHHLHELSILPLVIMTVSIVFLVMPTDISAKAITTHKNGVDRTQHFNVDSSSAVISDLFDIEKNDYYSDYTDTSTRLRPRLRKRHSDNFYIKNHLQESPSYLEWENPCGGTYDSSAPLSSVTPSRSYFLRNLRAFTSTTFHEISDMHSIDISNMKVWAAYNSFYRFLPRMSLNSNITLRTWYSQVQIYVASFAHLGRQQYNSDMHKYSTFTKYTLELNKLLLNARMLLCEIENTINGSYPQSGKKLKTISREDMNEHLSVFLRNQAHSQRTSPKMLDLQFVKLKYYIYTRKMWRVLRMKTKRQKQQNNTPKSSQSSIEKYRFDNDIYESNSNSLSLRNSESVSIESIEFQNLSRNHIPNKSTDTNHSNAH